MKTKKCQQKSLRLFFYGYFVLVNTILIEYKTMDI
jgi:hypothetical protein